MENILIGFTRVLLSLPYSRLVSSAPVALVLASLSLASLTEHGQLLRQSAQLAAASADRSASSSLTLSSY
jgi:hypothetical protein